MLDPDSRCVGGLYEAAGTVCNGVFYEGIVGRRFQLALLLRASGEASGSERISGSRRRFLYSVTASYLCVFNLSSACRGRVPLQTIAYEFVVVSTTLVRR